MANPPCRQWIQTRLSWDSLVRHSFEIEAPGFTGETVNVNGIVPKVMPEAANRTAQHHDEIGSTCQSYPNVPGSACHASCQRHGTNHTLVIRGRSLEGFVHRANAMYPGRW